MNTVRKASMPSRFDDFVCDFSRPKKRTAASSIDSEVFADRYSLPSVSRTIKYAPLAFVSPEDTNKWRRAESAYSGNLIKRDEKNYKSSPLYTRVKKVYERVKKAENDDFLTKGKLAVQKFNKKGLGVVATVRIPPKRVVNFYGGKITHIPREKEGEFLSNHYLFGLSQKNWQIDGQQHRSLAGLINHSKTPNLFPYLFEQTGEPTQVALISKRAIEVGEPLEYNYDEGRPNPAFFQATGETVR